MDFLIKKLTSKELPEFHAKFCQKISYNIPIEYLAMGDCYGLYQEGKLTAGYCLVFANMYKLRSISQIPNAEYYYYGNPKLEKLAEFTGYFIEDKRYAIQFTMHLMWKVLINKAERFVYSYPVYQTGLKEYYGQGKPWRLYKGVPRHLEGHTDNMEAEYVEVLTKYGVFRIFAHRTYKFARYAWLRSKAWKTIKRKTRQLLTFGLVSINKRG